MHALQFQDFLFGHTAVIASKVDVPHVVIPHRVTLSVLTKETTRKALLEDLKGGERVSKGS